MIYYLLLFKYADNHCCLIQQTNTYENFLGAVNDEIAHPSTEEEKMDWFIWQHCYAKGQISIDSVKPAVFALVTTSPLVIKSTLRTYREEQSFGIIITLQENSPEYEIACMPTASYKEIVQPIRVHISHES